jgi:RND family efflux transporter MFP subunit
LEPALISARTSLLLALSIGAAACGGGNGNAQQGPGGFGGMPPAEVQTLTLEPKPVPLTTEYVASIRSLSSTTIQPQVDGVIRRVLVRSGDRVRAGQPLVQIDPDKQQASVASLEAARVARQADVAYARQQLARMQKLFEAGAVSRQELEQAETAAADGRRPAQGDRVPDAREPGRAAATTASTRPQAGVVGDIPVRTGDRVTTSTVITTLDQNAAFEAYIQVPLDLASNLRPGLPVQLLDTDGRVIATNSITFIAPRVPTMRRRPCSQRARLSAAANTAGPAVRPGARRLADDARPDDPDYRGDPDQRAAFLLCGEPAGEGLVARQRPVQVGEIVGQRLRRRRGAVARGPARLEGTQKIGDGSPVRAE